MKREALIRELRRLAKERDVSLHVETGHGKGSHYRIHFGDRFTTLKSGEMTPGYVKLVRNRLGADE